MRSTSIYAILAAAGFACTEAPGPASRPTTGPPIIPKENPLATFSLHVDPASRTVTVSSGTGVSTSGRGIHAPAPVIHDGVPRSGPPQTFELVTFGVQLPGEGGCGANENCFLVELNSFLTRASSELMLVVDASTPVRTLQSDAAPPGSGLASAFGMRSFGDLGPGGTAVRELRFNVPDAAPYTVRLSLWEAPGPICPNAVVEGGEECDDGNAAPGDGCFQCGSEPSAVISDPQANKILFRDQPVFVNGTGSTDPHGGMLTYLWMLGDGQTCAVASGQCGSGYTSLGVFPITLTVTDAHGAYGTSAPTLIRIINRPPSAVVRITSNPGVTGQPVIFDPTTSSDLDGTIASFTIEFGENGVYSQMQSGSTLQPVSHVYNTAGTAMARLTVTDNDGGTGRHEIVFSLTYPTAIFDTSAFDQSSFGP